MQNLNLQQVVQATGLVTVTNCTRSAAWLISWRRYRQLGY